MRVIGVSRSDGPWTRGDISHFAEVENLIAANKPDFIFHLAANSTTSHEALFENSETIVTGTLNVLEVTRRYAPAAKVFITGSGLQFRNSGKPINEQTEFEATSAYSVARISSAYVARYYRSLGLKTYIGYLFHHESALRKPSHVSMKIAAAARAAANGDEISLVIGDPNVSKEWTFAGDVTEAILTLVLQDAVTEAVIGSGETHTILEWIDECYRGVDRRWQDFITFQENFQSEYKMLSADPALIRSLGWRPKISFSSLANAMINSSDPVGIEY
jgi:GDPmannose 4,6-dehydratase